MFDIVRIIRQNHALEHATIHVLTHRNPHIQLVGRSSATSFYLYGQVDTSEVADAAAEALARLQQGEAALAIHPRCGTNLVVTGVMAGTAAFSTGLLPSRSKMERLPMAIMAATVAALFAQPLALRVQEFVTTTADVQDVYIAEVIRQETGRFVSHKVLLGRSEG